jgi:EAL domain-containing protein (putative c-di-GMP-specific phosphodiesterase class I)
METVNSIQEPLAKLQEMGILLSVDDFGTGYSSLSYLHRFPINTLKVDRSFVSGLNQSQKQIVQTIITLAHSLKMDAIAEGVETPEQLMFLKSLGCEAAQGYLFSPPVCCQEAELLLDVSFPICNQKI